MSVAKVIEITSASNKSFEDAIEQGIRKAARTVDNIRSAWVAEQKVMVEGDRITEYRATMRITFVLSE